MKGEYMNIQDILKRSGLGESIVNKTISSNKEIESLDSLQSKYILKWKELL